MIETSQTYKDALNNQEQQHIFGALNFRDRPTISSIFLENSTGQYAAILSGTPTYSRQCTTVENEFGVGQLYTGTASITVEFAEEHKRYFDRLKGGYFSLSFRAGASEFVDLGLWTITDPRRDPSKPLVVTIEGADCISKLNVPINETYVGEISLESRMKKVTELTGVQFAQKADEIYAMIGGMSGYFGTTYAKTCREEVIAIAQLIGGFACDDREGRIVFKKFGSAPVAEITSSQRHSISLSEYSFGLRGVAYDNGIGRTTVVPFGAEKASPNTAVTVTLSGNPYINVPPSDYESDIDRETRKYLDPIALNLNIPDWNPGEVEIYGDPSLELGDMITISRGDDDTPVNFLITAEHWQFRGPHVLVSAGVSEDVAAGTSEPPKDKTQQTITVVNVTKSINTVDLKSYAGMLTDVLRTVSEGGFSCREDTTIFAEFTANIKGLGASDVRLNALYDGVKQTVHTIDRTEENGSLTVHFSVSVTASAGTHTVSAEACGNADIQRITGIVWGQGIVGEQAVPTNSEDYEFDVSGNRATITRYIGSSKKPSIPSVLDGADVKIIGDEAFYNLPVEFVYIPEGVEEIL